MEQPWAVAREPGTANVRLLVRASTLSETLTGRKNEIENLITRICGNGYRSGENCGG